MIKVFFITVFSLVLTSCFHKQEKIDVLIVDGFSNHDWKQTTKVVKHILDNSNLFNVSVYTTPQTPDDTLWSSWNPDFNKYNVIIQNTNNINNKQMQWPKRIQHKLEEYVNNGGGLYILHSANNAFEEWDEYNKMIGLGWRKKDEGVAITIDKNGNIIKIPRGEGENTYHGKRRDLIIKILTHHPINKNYPSAWKSPDMELYKYARGPAENITVLSYAYDSATNTNWPVEWIINYGKGHVYNSTFGHLWKGQIYPDSYRCIGFQTTLIRAVEWLGSGKVTYPVPADFPTKNSISITSDTTLSLIYLNVKRHLPDNPKSTKRGLY